MLDIKFLRENPEAVKENIRKKFQESKLDLVDQVVGGSAGVGCAAGSAHSWDRERKKKQRRLSRK